MWWICSWAYLVLLFNAVLVKLGPLSLVWETWTACLCACKNLLLIGVYFILCLKEHDWTALGCSYRTVSTETCAGHQCQAICTPDCVLCLQCQKHLVWALLWAKINTWSGEVCSIHLSWVRALLASSSSQKQFIESFPSGWGKCEFEWWELSD